VSAGHLRPGVQGVKDQPPRSDHCGEGFALRQRGNAIIKLPATRFGSAGRPIRGYSMNPFLWLIHTLIWIYIYLLIGAAVLSWLIAFNVVNSHNPTVRMIWDFLYRVTEPGLRPIRSVLPNLGGIDISPVILIIALMFLDQLIIWLFVSAFS
jgi:YggT family protein